MKIKITEIEADAREQHSCSKFCKSSLKVFPK